MICIKFDEAAWKRVEKIGFQAYYPKVRCLFHAIIVNNICCKMKPNCDCSSTGGICEIVIFSFTVSKDGGVVAILVIVQ
jgi:hypothetical protein